MKRLSFEDIASYWTRQNGFLKNTICLNDEVADIDSILDNVYNIITTKTTINEGKSNRRKTSKRKPTLLPPHEYVANKVGNRVTSKYGNSFYDHSHIIKIILEDGTEVEGEIRISNHEVDLAKWAENNTHDFGISIVVYEEEYELIGNNIVETGNRMISIFEYIFNVNRANQNMLDVLSAQILSIKIPKKYIQNQPIQGTKPSEITNKHLDDTLEITQDKLSSLSEKLILNISKVIQEELSKN